MNPVAFERRGNLSACVVPLMPGKKYGIGGRGYPRERISPWSGALLAPYLLGTPPSRALPARRIDALCA